MTCDSLPGFRNMLAPLALGAAALFLSACNPQNATPPERLSRESAASTAVVAVDVQRNTGARHLLAAECGSATCKINYTRRPNGTGAPLLATVATTSSRSVSEMSIAALNDGGAVAVWMESISSGDSHRFRFSVISAAGVASPPANLDATGATVSPSSAGFRTLDLSSDGTRVIAIYEGTIANVERIHYRQLTPAVTAQGLVFDQSSMGGPGRVENLSVKLAAGSVPHMTWRQVRTGSDPGAGSQVGYAIGAVSGSPDVPAASRFVLSSLSSRVGMPELAIDTVPSPQRVWVAYHETQGTASQMRVVRVTAGAPVQTHTLAFAALPYVFVGSTRPALAFNSSVPVLGILIDDSGDTAVTKDAAVWRSNESDVTRLSNSGIANGIKATTYNGLAAVFAYTELRGTGPSAFTVYDAFHERSLLMNRQPLGGGFDLVASGQVVAGAWIVREGSSNVAYDARNDATPEGRIEITTLADDNLANPTISLREALLISNGGLTSGFSPEERQALERGGCIFNSSGAIVGGCGRGITDTLLFTSTITGTVSLLTPLPAINDTAPTRLAGGSRRGSPRIQIDGSAQPSLGAVLTVNSTNNEINGLHLHGGQRGVWLLNNGNAIENAVVTSATLAGIDLQGNENTLTDVYVGAPRDEVTCRLGRNHIGVHLQGAAARNLLRGLQVKCSETHGIVLDGPGVISNTLVASFAGSTAPESANRSGGLLLRNGARENTLGLSLALNNGGPGIALVDAPDNVLFSGAVISNTGPGIVFSGAGAQRNQVNSFQILSNTTGIVQQSGAGANQWQSNAHGPAGSGRAIDTGVIGADDLPGATLQAYYPLTRTASGIGATPGATVTVHALVRIGAVEFAYAMSSTVAGPDGAWSATLPPLPSPDDGLEEVVPITPLRAEFGPAPIFGDLPQGPLLCMRVMETSAAAGSSELSPPLCGYAVLAPLVLR